MAENGNGGDQGNKGGAGDKGNAITPEAFEALNKTVNQLKQENSDIVQELNLKKKELNDKLEREKKDKEASLAEQGKFKELAETREKELAAMQQRVVDQQVEMELREAARKAGLQDLDTLKLVDRANIKVNDGKVTGVEDAIKTFKTAKPYLFGKGTGQGGFGVNNAGVDRLGGIDPHNLTPEEIEKLSPEDRRAVIDALRPANAIKSGSPFTRARERALGKK